MATEEFLMQLGDVRRAEMIQIGEIDNPHELGARADALPVSIVRFSYNSPHVPALTLNDNYAVHAELLAVLAGQIDHAVENMTDRQRARFAGVRARTLRVCREAL